MKRESILLISLWALAFGFSFSRYESLTEFLFMLAINASFLIPIIKSAFTLDPADRNRILDLLVIGVALYWKAGTLGIARFARGIILIAS